MLASMCKIHFAAQKPNKNVDLTFSSAGSVGFSTVFSTGVEILGKKPKGVVFPCRAAASPDRAL
jgi:hypothetical protein